MAEAKKCRVCQKPLDIEIVNKNNGRIHGYIEYANGFCSHECELKTQEKEKQLFRENRQKLRQKINEKIQDCSGIQENLLELFVRMYAEVHLDKLLDLEL